MQDPSKVDVVAGALETMWTKPQDMFSVMDAVHAYCVTEHQICPHFYVPVLLGKVLHKLRHLCRIAYMHKQQAQYITEYVNLVLDKNSQQGQCGRLLLTTPSL